MAVVYIDEVFILNFIVNLILLFATRRIICLHNSKIMVYVGAALGGIYSSLVFVPQLQVFYTLFGKFVFSVFLVGFSFGIKRIKEYCKAVAVFYLISFGFGGAGYGIISLLQYKGGSFPLLLLALSTGVAYGLIVLADRHKKSKLLKEEQTVELRIAWMGREVTIPCLVDTGNALYEPFTRRPVIVTESEQLRPLIPEGVEDGSVLQCIEHLNAKDPSIKIRLIPFRSLGQDNGVILGFIPDQVWVVREQRQIPVKHAVIGLYEGRLSSDDRYCGLMNPETIQYASFS